MKKLLKWFFIVCFIQLTLVSLQQSVLLGPHLTAHATVASKVTEEDLSTEVISQLESIDYSELETFYEDEVDLDLFKNKSIVEVLTNLVTTGESINFSDVWQLVTRSISKDITSVLKLVALIVAIVGFGSFSQLLESFSKNGSGISSVVNFFILSLILSIVATVIADFVSDTTNLLYKIRALMEAIFPILLSLLITIGGSSTSLALQPAVVILTGGVIELIVIATTLAVSLYLVLSVLGELTDAVKLSSLKNFIASTYKWLIGLTFTIYMAYMSINGLVASGADKVSIKTAKYAIRSYIPLVGGYVSDSYEIFRVGSVLIKNSFGVVGIIILMSLVIGKVVTLILYNLGFKLAGGLTEPMATTKVSRFLSSLSTIFNFLIAGIMACVLLCGVTLLIIMSSANLL